MASLHKTEGLQHAAAPCWPQQEQRQPQQEQGVAVTASTPPSPSDRELCPCTGTASYRQESEEGMQKQEPWEQQVLFIYFPNPQAKQPQIMAVKGHTAESSAPELLGVPPSWSSQCWPAAQGDAGSSQEHPLRLVSRHNLARLNVKAFITFIQTKSMHVKTCKYGHKHPILFALLNFCP